MAIQVRPTRSAPGPNTGLRGRRGDEANVGVCHQGSERYSSIAAAGYMCAILTRRARSEGSLLATGRSPYMSGAARGCNQQPKSRQPQPLRETQSPLAAPRLPPPLRSALVYPLDNGGLRGVRWPSSHAQTPAAINACFATSGSSIAANSAAG